jgi:sugar/nucleoside kinase (ribokinase family)
MDIITPVCHLPDSNEVFEVYGIDIQGGGPVATALVALAKLGARVAYQGALAESRWGQMIIDEFEQYGIDTSLCQRFSEGESPVAVILVEPDGNRSILYEKGRQKLLGEQDVDIDRVAAARILHLDGNHPDAAVKAAEVARQCETLVSLDGGAGEGKWKGMAELIPLVDILIVARQFALRHTGHDDPLKAGPALLARGAQFVVITDGENGSWYWDDSWHFHQPALAVDVRDTTGAGDTYHGAYLYAYLQGWSPEECLRFASAVAALKCTQPGGRKGIPSLEQALDFLKKSSKEQS